MEFWRILYDHLAPMELDDNAKDILSDVNLLACFLSELNEENAQWLSHSAPFAHRKHNSGNLIEELHRLKDTGNPSDTARMLSVIFLNLVENYLPDWRQDQIIDIMRFIYEHGDIDTRKRGKNIRDLYVTAKQYWLHEALREYE
jgi:hypothetical protein